MRDTLGVLLAGGAGERLYPLTRDRAKPAVTFGGIYRIIDITLSNCINSDLRRVYILTQYKALSLNRHIREGWGNSWPSELGEFIEILPPMKRVSENWYMGTADAVYQNIYSIGSEAAEVCAHPVRRPHLQDELRPDAAAAQGLRRRRHAGHDSRRADGDPRALAWSRSTAPAGWSASRRSPSRPTCARPTTRAWFRPRWAFISSTPTS